jgi:hypothetical protein
VIVVTTSQANSATALCVCCRYAISIDVSHTIFCLLAFSSLMVFEALLYYNSPMPHSIFFHGGYAIHGSYEINRLGGPASHGCIRLHPANAAALFELVKSEGLGATTIVVSGGSPVLASRPAPSRQPYAVWQTPTYEDRYRSDYGQPYYWRPEPRTFPFFNSY